jgi:hypothetical protein
MSNKHVNGLKTSRTVMMFTFHSILLSGGIKKARVNKQKEKLNKEI